MSTEDYRKVRVPYETVKKLQQCKIDPPVVVKWSKRDGLGVFTNRDVYKRRSTAATNVCIFPFPILAHWYFAARDMKKGEELVISYGIDFWHRWYLTCEEDSIRLSAALLLHPSPFANGPLSDEALDQLLGALKFTDTFRDFKNRFHKALLKNGGLLTRTDFELFTILVKTLFDFDSLHTSPV